MPIFRYHTITVCYLLDRQSHCPVTYSVTSFILPFMAFTSYYYPPSLFHKTGTGKICCR